MPRWMQTCSASCFLAKSERLAPAARRVVLRLRAEHDPELFAMALFPDHCRLPFAEHHRALFGWHRAMGDEALPARTGRRFVLAAPRGAAKSTVASLILPLHDIVFARERYIVLLSATERQAMQRLRALRREVERGPVAAWLPAGEAHMANRSLTVGGVQIDAHGAGCEIRGITAGPYRPTKIILDDAEASAAADSPRARERLAQWFHEVVEHLGDRYTHIVAIGTVLHPRGLIAMLAARPDFQSMIARSVMAFPPNNAEWQRWRAILADHGNPDRRRHAREHFLAHRPAMESGAQVLWPEKEDIEELMTQLALQGRRAFYQEKQNEPLGPEDAVFDAASVLRAEFDDGAWIVRRSDSPGVVRRLTDQPRRFAHLDAAMGRGGRTGRGDFAALAVVLLFGDGTLLLERLWARRLPPSEQVTRLFALHDATPLERLAIEGTGFQELLLLPIEEERRRRRADGRRSDLAVEAVSPRQTKSARIASLEPLLSNGTLILGQELDEEFWEELANWPRARHDDALDALAGAVALALRSAGAPGDRWQGTGRRRTAGPWSLGP